MIGEIRTPEEGQNTSRQAAEGGVRRDAAPPGTYDRKRSFSFGPFRLIPSERLLLESDRPVRLGSRALDILIALVARPGELVGKRELMSSVWPDTVVAEGNLPVHLVALRRALGDGQAGNRYIVNIPGRGYRFVAPVNVADELRTSAQRTTTDRPHNLPTQLTRLIGRAEVVSSLVMQLPKQRLLTIVGPGGIGKTAVALAVAERLMGAYEHGIWLIDLASVADPRLVPTALAATLRLEIRSDDPLPSLIAALGHKQMLLVLDNCGHVIEAAASLAASVLRDSRGVRILATSRESLRLTGERVHRLPPLKSPPPSVRLSAAEALGFSAVQLFAERAAAAMNEFELNDADAPSAGEICRRLDGIPLAIEFAAARIDAFGVRGVAERLDDRLRLLRAGRRGDPPRHQTISAALDWSYQVLGQEEQTVFRRLAIFAGDFTLEAARAVAGDTDGGSQDIAESVADLVMKSLVTADIGDGEVRFRLLETTRAYALTKLAESGEAGAIARHHAAYYRDALEAAQTRSADDDADMREIDNIRAALTSAFAPGGDRSIATALAAASAPIWLGISLTECHDWTEKALDLLDAEDRGTRREMVLQTVLGISLMYTWRISSRAQAALTRASELAESLRDFEYQVRAIAGLAVFCLRRGDYRGALALRRRAEVIARGVADPVVLSTAEWSLGDALFFLGDYAEALTYARQARRRATHVVRRAHMVRSGIDPSIQAGIVVVRILWVQGLLDQSAQIARDVLAEAQAGPRPVSLSLALTWCGCSISLGLGDLDAAEESIGQLKDHAQQHALNAHYAYGLGFEGQLAARRGDIATGERLLRACLDGLARAESGLFCTPFLSGLAEVLATAGRLDESLAAADEALELTLRAGRHWWMTEALRIKGEVLLLSNRAEEAEEHFRRSLDLARQQGALLWELHTAMSLGQLHHAQDRTHDARDLLNSVYSRFTEGFAASDLQRARRLLEAWTSSQADSFVFQKAGQMPG